MFVISGRGEYFFVDLRENNLSAGKIKLNVEKSTVSKQDEATNQKGCSRSSCQTTGGGGGRRDCGSLPYHHYIACKEIYRRGVSQYLRAYFYIVFKGKLGAQRRTYLIVCILLRGFAAKIRLDAAVTRCIVQKCNANEIKKSG